jgi:hypothetical protein
MLSLAPRARLETPLMLQTNSLHPSRAAWSAVSMVNAPYHRVGSKAVQSSAGGRSVEARCQRRRTYWLRPRLRKTSASPAFSRRVSCKGQWGQL